MAEYHVRERCKGSSWFQASSRSRGDEHDPVPVTVDLNLPGMDSLEAARHIRARSQAPVLFISRSVVADETAGRVA